jgi:hypothetical protein
MTSHAVIDFIGLPVVAPGQLRCRMQLGEFGSDGAWLDDGSRTGPQQTQRNRHTVVVAPGESIGRVFEGVTANLARDGFAAPDTGILRHVAQHEWRDDVLAARRDRLKAPATALRLVVRALGFDIEGRGEFAIGLGKAIVRRGDVTMLGRAR